MAPDPPARHREAELATLGFSGEEIKAGQAQPADGQVLQRVADLKDPQQATREVAPVVDRRVGVLVLQRALTGHAQTRCAEIVTWRLAGALPGQRRSIKLLIWASSVGR
jgi:hypothetical protein